MNRRTVLFAISAATVIGAPSAALAASASGGAAEFPANPTLESVQCPGSAQWRCHRGEVMTIKGADLSAVRTIVFLGGKGRKDDRKVKPQSTSDTEVLVKVPRGARSGPLRAKDGVRTVKAKRNVRIVKGSPVAAADPSAAAAGSPDGVFPIDGAHDMGQTETNNFGGGRNHGGQDLFAKCGTPLVAVRSGVVQIVKFQDRAGNYVVLQSPDGQSYAYMHLQSPSPLKAGDPIKVGDPVGKVGDTGAASGCHLHFELWTAPGWYTGGVAIDPLPQLKRWEAGHDHS